MQVLYAMNRDKALENKVAFKRYQADINKSFELFLLALLYFSKILAYAEKDKAKRNDKLRPSEEDLAFIPVLATNELSKSLIHHENFNMLCKRRAIQSRIDDDIVRRLYVSFHKTEEAIEYAKANDTDAEKSKAIILALLKHMIGSEMFIDHLDEHFPNLIDDKSLVIGALKKVAKALPVEGEFYDAYRPTEETFQEFGEVLLEKVVYNAGELQGIIEPMLQNWDADRVAIIDMIILKMALAELLYFPTIPTKVTLNEFVEVAKQYSTDKSKDFINGVLDRLMKDLEEKGKIEKKGRGLIDI